MDHSIPYPCYSALPCLSAEHPPFDGQLQECTTRTSYGILVRTGPERIVYDGFENLCSPGVGVGEKITNIEPVGLAIGYSERNSR